MRYLYVVTVLIFIGCNVKNNEDIIAFYKQDLNEKKNSDYALITDYFERTEIAQLQFITMRKRDKGAYVIFENEKEQDITKQLNIPEEYVERWRTIDGLYSFSYDINKRLIYFYVTPIRNESYNNIVLIYYFNESAIKCASCDSVVKGKGFDDLKGFECKLDSNWTVWSPYDKD